MIGVGIDLAGAFLDINGNTAGFACAGDFDLLIAMITGCREAPDVPSTFRSREIGCLP